jgi:hypothetical protein
MPVQDVRLTDVAQPPRQSSAPRPTAVDAVRWAATLLTQLGVEPDASKGQRKAA